MLLRGKPVSGVGLQVGDYVLQARTNAAGQFNYRADTTLPERHVATVTNVNLAKIGGKPLSAADKSALLGTRGGFSVGYKVTDLHTSRGAGGNVVLTGRAVFATGKPVPPVALYTYQLSGTVTDAAGKPVVGAIVVTRTTDRDFWTFSKPTDSAGHYTSFFSASDEAGDNPVPLSVQVASGPNSFSSGTTATVKFNEVQSATLDIHLPGQPDRGDGAADAELVPGCDLRGPDHGRLVGERPDQAAVGELARQERALPAHAAGIGARQAARHLGGPRSGLLELPGDARRALRHEVLPDEGARSVPAGNGDDRRPVARVGSAAAACRIFTHF